MFLISTPGFNPYDFDWNEIIGVTLDEILTIPF